MRRSLPVLLAALIAGAPLGAQAADPTVYAVRPSSLDAAVKAFDDPSVIVVHSDHPTTAPLVVFMTGTGGRPQNLVPFLSVIADQGYPVIGLSYDDTPAVSQVCPRDPDPACSADFRRMRIDGDGPGGGVHNPKAEAIVPRLTELLSGLAKTQPSQGWGAYLAADGAPNWSRIIVSGLSQGAGMAAYIAKAHPVARVVLFSSPWDVTGSQKRPAPWLSTPSATPPDLWYAEYHKRELTARLIANAYVALNIPADHIRVFDHDLPPNPGQSPNPFHVNTIRDRSYLADWQAMFGRAQ